AGAAAEGRQRVGGRGVKVAHLGVADRTPEPQRRTHVEMVRDPQGHDRHAAGRRRPRERRAGMRGEPRRVAAAPELAEERHHLRLATAPGPLGVDVQHAHGYGSRSRIRTASATHMAIATSLSPKLYWVTPPTRKPTSPAHAPAAVARVAASGASAMAAQPQRSAVAKRSP